MTLAMALDNSFEIMNEDEMYDVNGGKWIDVHVHDSFVDSALGMEFGTATKMATATYCTVLGMKLGLAAGGIYGMAFGAIMGAFIGGIIMKKVGSIVYKHTLANLINISFDFPFYIPFRKNDIHLT